MDAQKKGAGNKQTYGFVLDKFVQLILINHSQVYKGCNKITFTTKKPGGTYFAYVTLNKN